MTRRLAPGPIVRLFPQRVWVNPDFLRWLHTHDGGAAKIRGQNLILIESSAPGGSSVVAPPSVVVEILYDGAGKDSQPEQKTHL